MDIFRFVQYLLLGIYVPLESLILNNGLGRGLSDSVRSCPCRAVWQSVTLNKGTYTLSAYVKTEGVVPREPWPVFGATIGIDYISGSKVSQTVASTDVQLGTSDTAIDGGWQRISVTFEVQEKDTNIRVWGGLNYASGKAWFDCFQLEEGEVPEGYNLLNNHGSSAELQWRLWLYLLESLQHGEL